VSAANDNASQQGRALAQLLGIDGLVAGGVPHVCQVTVRPVAASCGTFKQVSALLTGYAAADLAGRYTAVQRLPARPALRLVDRLA
jgi:hypothetical protein